MIKKGNHLKQILAVGLILTVSIIFVCINAISRGNKDENEISILQEQDTTTKSSNPTIQSADIKPDTVATIEPESSIIPSATTEPDVSTIKPNNIKETTQNDQIITYTISHEKDNSTYDVVLIRDENRHSTIQLFDDNSTMMQTLELGSIYGKIEFEDVNKDGYTDIVLYTGGTRNETHDLYIWDISSKNFIKVIYEGFEMLAWYTAHEGYVENFIRGDSPDESYKQRLIWNGNILTKDSE